MTITTLTQTTTVAANTKTNNKGGVNMKNFKLNQEVLVGFNALDVKVQEYVQAHVANISVAPFYSFVVNPETGEFPTAVKVNVARKRFVVEYAAAQKRAIAFDTPEAKNMMSYLMSYYPMVSSEFAASKTFAALTSLELASYIGVKHVRENRLFVLISAIKDADVWAIKGDVVVGKVAELKADDLEALTFTTGEGDSKKTTVRNNVKWAVAKNLDKKALNSSNTFYQLQQDSLSYSSLAKFKGIAPVELKVPSIAKVNHREYLIEENKNVLPLQNVVTFSFGAVNGEEGAVQAISQSIADRVMVFNASSVTFEAGMNIRNIKPVGIARTADATVSQQRGGDTIGFIGKDDAEALQWAADYLQANGLGANGFAVALKQDGQPTGLLVHNVKKSRKRNWLPAGSGITAKRGFFKEVRLGAKAEMMENSGFGKAVAERIRVTGTKLTKASTRKEVVLGSAADFQSMINQDQDFNVIQLKENKELIGAMHVASPAIKKQLAELKGEDSIMARNVTDGLGYITSELAAELREAGMLNENNAFQIRVCGVIKGLLVVNDEICEHYGVDILFLEGMIKMEGKDISRGQRIMNHINTIGFDLYQVGQCNDAINGTWVDSQASQQMYLSVEDRFALIDATIEHFRGVLNEKLSSEFLNSIGFGSETAGTSLTGVNVLRNAIKAEATTKKATEKISAALDAQYFKDEKTAMVVKVLNNLLDSKFYVANSRTRYMVPESAPINAAAKRGDIWLDKKDATLEINQVVAPSKRLSEEEGKKYDYFFQTGKALSQRSPVSNVMELPVVEAIEIESMREYVEAGHGEGIVFYDCFSWVVEMQSGADHDGDKAKLLFSDIIVNAVERTVAFGGIKRAPYVNAWVIMDGETVVDCDKGAPTFKKDVVTTVVEETPQWVQNGNLLVRGTEIAIHPSSLNCPETMANYYKIQAAMTKEITIKGMESAKTGIIADQIMIMTDLLTRGILTTEESIKVQTDIMDMTGCAWWELDRPKHGGAFESMPRVEELYSNFMPVIFDNEGEHASWNNEKKHAFMASEKAHYQHIFQAQFNKDGEITRFSMKKPAWLAIRKEQVGMEVNSLMQYSYNYAKTSLENFCREARVAGTDANNAALTELMVQHAGAEQIQYLYNAVGTVYAKYNATMQDIRNREEAAKAKVMAEMTEKRKFGKKDVALMTESQKNGLMKKEDASLAEFSREKEFAKLVLRKDIYALNSQSTQSIDPRYFVATLICGIANTTQAVSADAFRADGRKVAFNTSSFAMATIFEIFEEEVLALIDGPITEVSFVPANIQFVTLTK